MQTDSVWDRDSLTAVPEVEIVTEAGERSGAADLIVRELFYTSPGSDGSDLRIFAHYARPPDADSPLPAVVWVHGGASIGSREAVIEWAGRGYAALSMDLPGKGGEVRAGSRSTGPDMSDDNIFRVEPGPRESYLFLCVNAVCRAVSMLAHRPEVDAARIGVLGYSWGGVITLLANGIDDRITAACTVYGAGFIPDESIWTARLRAGDPGQVELWRTHFDPSSYLATQHGRTLFASATGDEYFSVRSFIRTYERAQREKALYLAPNLNHEMDEHGPATIVRWFDHALGGGPSLPRVSVGRAGDRLTVPAANLSSVSQVLRVAADSPDLRQAFWRATPMQRQADAWTCPAPDPGIPFYVIAIEDTGAAVAGGHSNILGENREER